MIRNFFRKLLCKLGFHTLLWYSKHDCYLWGTGRVTGPLYECKYCDLHSRIENNRPNPKKKFERSGTTWKNSQ